MTTSYRDEILDLLADGNARTVEEIREAIGADKGARIHHVMAALVTSMRYKREIHPVKVWKFRGFLYYGRPSLEQTWKTNGCESDSFCSR